MESSNITELVRNQFNKQAENFSNWPVTQNRDYMQRYFAACEMTPEDTLLDVGCGSGEFTIFAAAQIKRAVGVDLSDRMIELARMNASEHSIKNATFICHDVSDIPADDNSFSIAICKSVFHHLHDYDKVMSEMVRCCESGGRISIQDIVAYENDYVNDFFEQLERWIDISHRVSLSKQFFQKLYEEHNLTITWAFDVTVELNFKDYLTHAVRSEECSAQIERLLRKGLGDTDICEYFLVKKGELCFKRNVFLVTGKKH